MLQRDRLAMATIRRCTASCFLTQIVIEFVIYLNETKMIIYTAEFYMSNMY